MDSLPEINLNQEEIQQAKDWREKKLKESPDNPFLKRLLEMQIEASAKIPTICSKCFKAYPNFFFGCPTCD